VRCNRFAPLFIFSDSLCQKILRHLKINSEAARLIFLKFIATE